jgi:ubiquinone/menaquinone biosynthesis C-methylase UbiE
MRVDENGFFLREDILETFGIRKKNVLDIGTGPLGLLAAQTFECQVTTIDFSPEAVQRFRRDVSGKQLGGMITVRCADAAHLPYGARAFDAVVCYGALHHTPPGDRARCVGEMIRVTRELTVIAELTEAGFNRTHGGGRLARVSLEWLQAYLAESGSLLIHTSPMMVAYGICPYSSPPAP